MHRLGRSPITLLQDVNGEVNGSSSSNQEFEEVPWISEVDVLRNIKIPLGYDSQQERFVTVKQVERAKASSILRPILSSAFIPDGVTDSYFQYMRWRFLQRFVNANLHVIGTQSCLLYTSPSPRD